MIYDTLFRLSLKLYPAEFQADFEDEMLDTYHAHLHDNSNKINVVIKELFDTVRTAMMLRVDCRKQWYASLSRELRTLHQARWIIRMGSLMNALFLVLVTLEPYAKQSSPENLAFLVLFTLQLVCVLFALRWERIGGIIMLTTTLTITPIIFFSTMLPGYEYLSIIASVLWTLPFASFAIGYLMLGQRNYKIQQRIIA